jgi:hypothetical protein
VEQTRQSPGKTALFRLGGLTKTVNFAWFVAYCGTWDSPEIVLVVSYNIENKSLNIFGQPRTYIGQSGTSLAL